MATQWMFTAEEIAEQLPTDPSTMKFRYALRNGSMKIGLYAPDSVDEQTPHNQDELYLIVSGSGEFVKNGERMVFQPNTAIFVEAGADHRFENFSDDFSTWVVFWGPDGGETTNGD